MIYLDPNAAQKVMHRAELGTERTLVGTRSPRGIRVDAEQELLDLFNPMFADIRREMDKLAAFFDDKTRNNETQKNTSRSNQSPITPSMAAAILRQLLAYWGASATSQAQHKAQTVVGAVNAYTKNSFASQIAQSLGAQSVFIADGSEVAAALEMAAVEYSQLITRVPGQVFDDVTRSVLAAFRGEPNPEGRTFNQQIAHLLNASEEQVQVITRDQTAKMTSMLNQARFDENGVKEYVWRIAGGIRVVGNPGGLYPKGNDKHGNHWERNGKVFRLDSPPHDGHPGEPIQCRCRMEPVINWKYLQVAA